MKLKSYLFRNYILSNIDTAINEDLKDKYPSENWKETHDKDEELKKKIDFKNHSNLALYKCYDVNSKYYITGIYGGLNGNGKWSEYLDDIKHIIDEIKDCWIIDLEVDVPDDVWTLWIGFNKD